MHKSVTLYDMKRNLALHFPASYKSCLIKCGFKEPIVENWKIRFEYSRRLKGKAQEQISREAICTSSEGGKNWQSCVP